jgi:hypothetical protein
MALAIRNNRPNLSYELAGKIESRPRLMRRFLRYLRIAFSVACGLACVLLIALWVRSYRWHDTLDGRLAQSNLNIMSACGEIRVTFVSHPQPVAWSFYSSRIEKGTWVGLAMGARGQSQIYFPKTLMVTWMADRKIHWFVTWLPTCLFGTCAILPWVRSPRRFSVRTLLIATTLVAVVLGAIVYAAR